MDKCFSYNPSPTKEELGFRVGDYSKLILSLSPAQPLIAASFLPLVSEGCLRQGRPEVGPGGVTSFPPDSVKHSPLSLYHLDQLPHGDGPREQKANSRDL